jgi:hypothetical protein
MKEKPKKERRFLKAIGRVGEILIQEVLIKIGSNLIKKIGGKKTLPSILFLLASLSLFAQYPNTGNKQRLGFQTTGDGLTWRGSESDTAAIQPINNQNAWVILDTVNLKFYSFDFTSNVWNSVGGAAFTQPVDSLFFNVNVPTNNVDTAKMRWDSDLATVVLGMYDQVPNELGFKNFWLVKNQTGSTITKGSIVYANGTVGASGRITIDKFIADGSIDAKYLLGITAHDLSNGEDGYVISFGKIRKVNTDTFAAGAILYPSPTVAGVWTDVEPIAPNLDMPIGFCINSHANNGTIAIRVASGYKLSELHDVAITSPVENASLYYSGGLWRDTTPTLLVSDTASMLANYATKEYADTTGRLYERQDFTNVETSTLTWTQTDTLIPGGVTVVQVYRNGQILLPSQYTIPTSTSVVIAATSFKVGENYTVIFPRGGGAGSGGGSGSLTSISGGTGILVSPNPITTTGTVSADLSVLMELTDTSLLNLTSRLATKLNISDTAAMLSSYNTRIDTKLNISDTASMLSPYFLDADTSLLNLNSRFALKLNADDTASLSSRIDAKGTGTVTSVATGYGITGGTITTTGTLVLDSAVVFSQIRDSIVDVAIGTDTIKILKQEYAPATTSVLTWTITPKFPIQLKAYILVFRNGQLLINDQYNLTDTNQITIVSNSFKVGANYTVVTVSGIGSVGTGVFPNPVYPEAGIALSTGSAWASSIPNNSANWNIAFNDKITNAAFTGTTTKTLTLTQYDGGTFTPTFNDLQGVTEVTAGTGLTGGTITSTGTVAVDFGVVAPLADPTFTGTVSGITKTMVGLGNVDNTSDADKPISTLTQTALNGKENTITAGTTGQYYRGDKTFQTLDKSAVGLGNVDNTSDLNKPISTATQTALDLKAPINSPTFTGTVSGITNSMVGLGNVDNTSDLNKPISTATQTALNGKQNTLNGTGFVKASGTTISYDNSTYLTTGTAASTYQTILTNPVTGTGTNDFIAKFTSTGSTIGNSVIQESGGNIGIGKTPEAKLDVNGDLYTNGTSYNFNNVNNRNGYLYFDHSGVQVWKFGLFNDNSSTLSLGNGGNFNRIFNITNNGNIGINDTTPLFTLDVNGTLNATGATTLGSTLAVTGAVTINDELNLSSGYLKRGYISSGSSSVTVGDNDTWVRLANLVSVSLTLPSASSFSGREIHVLNVSNGSVISASTNVIDLTGNLGFAILSSGGGKWATLVSNGTHWQIMAGN